MMLNLLILILILTAWLVFRLRKLEAKVNTLIQGISRIQWLLDVTDPGESTDKLPGTDMPAGDPVGQTPPEENSHRPRLFDFSRKYEDYDPKK